MQNPTVRWLGIYLIVGFVYAMVAYAFSHFGFWGIVIHMVLWPLFLVIYFFVQVLTLLAIAIVVGVVLYFFVPTVRAFVDGMLKTFGLMK